VDHSGLRVGGGSKIVVFFFSSRRRHTRLVSDWSSDVCSSDLTLVNIRDTGEFVTNLVTLPQAHHMHRSAAEFDSSCDEFDEVGLVKETCDVVQVPRVKEAPIAFECTLDRIIPVGDVQDHVVWGKVVRFHIRDDLYTENGRIDTGAIPTVGRLAAEYTLADNAFITPLTEDVLRARAGRRMHRIDEHPDGWSAVDGADWSPS